ncbi:MAG: hypothetical protein HC895_25290 [Leptolyngbyaceae cyanobacterium SM1_3_5]|nr:hypothetical protein [Leptolyngbyaceae cyanobacterium SM1_3_5]
MRESAAYSSQITARQRFLESRSTKCRIRLQRLGGIGECSEPLETSLGCPLTRYAVLKFLYQASTNFQWRSGEF